MTDAPFFHGQFAINREWAAAPAKIFRAFSEKALKMIWFAGPSDVWETIAYDFDFSVGGVERWEGRHIASGMRVLYQGRNHLIEDGRRIVFDYDMHLDGKHHSVSLGAILLEPNGAKTKVIYEEHVVFVDGANGTASRKEGSEELYNAIEKVVMES